jgi:hydroxymethylglutaryl-CoA synthase
VTLAVNAAHPILTDDDRAKIGLLIVSSESAVDQEKPLSPWVHRYLGLPSSVRNFEVKHACYGATGAVQVAAGLLASGVLGDKKALIINTDLSRAHFGKPWELVMGAGAAAVLLSTRPAVLEIELGRSGVYTNEVSDLTRPTLRVETGNSETSLVSYMDALESALDAYLEVCPEASDLEGWFQRHVFHMPFGGMAFRAHRAFLRRIGVTDRSAVGASFEARTRASLTFARRMGGTYGASTFLGLMGLVAHDPEWRPGERTSIFAYGSGSCGELWSGHLGEDARSGVRSDILTAALDARRPVTVAEYERIEALRTERIELGDYATDRAALGAHYRERYEGRGLLVFDGMREFYRRYSWS